MIRNVLAALLVAALTIAGWQTWQLHRLGVEFDEQRTTLARAEGNVLTCTARIANLLRAEERNDAIPDDLHDFDWSRWMLVE